MAPMNKIRKIAQNKSHTPLQFLKYVLAGVIASGTYLVSFTLLNETILPAGIDQPGASRGWNFFFSNSVAFTAATIVAYIINQAWVFQPGRHGRLKEFSLFYLIAAVAFLAGTPLGSIVIAHFPVNEYGVFVLVVGFSAMVNFLGRKYWVFLH
jgi:putative flippase GtrA